MQHQPFKQCLAAVLLVAGTQPALAGADVFLCGEQPIKGGLNVHADPESIKGCVRTGRIFCRLADARDAHMSEAAAVRSVGDWLGSFNTTGSHVPNAAPAALPQFADFVYGHPELTPWTLYYQATYQCAAGARAEQEPAKQRRALERFDALAEDCGKRFPAHGDGRGNEELRSCLLKAVNKS